MTELASTTTGVDLDSPVDHVVAALEDPDLLSAWLGEWTDGGDGRSTVRTDDGIDRIVTDRAWHGDELRWRWHNGDESTASEVAIRLMPLDGGATRLIVRETRASADTTRTWTGCLFAMGAVLAAGSLVRT